MTARDALDDPYDYRCGAFQACQQQTPAEPVHECAGPCRRSLATIDVARFDGSGRAWCEPCDLLREEAEALVDEHAPRDYVVEVELRHVYRFKLTAPPCAVLDRARAVLGALGEDGRDELYVRTDEHVHVVGDDQLGETVRG